MIRLVNANRTFNICILTFLLIESECVLHSLNGINFCRSDLKKSSIEFAESQDILDGDMVSANCPTQNSVIRGQNFRQLLEVAILYLEYTYIDDSLLMLRT